MQIVVLVNQHASRKGTNPYRSVSYTISLRYKQNMSSIGVNHLRVFSPETRKENEKFQKAESIGHRDTIILRGS